MNWHARYSQQAAWTAELRAYLYQKSGLPEARRVLEVGCGTGAILSELRAAGAVHGLDIAFPVLGQARQHAPHARLTCGDALALPYPQDCFDLTCCHFLLLWVSNPLHTLLEMARVTRRGGYLLAMAEPDYLARRDQPAELAEIGRLQTQALAAQGADPGLGARLAELFARAGITIIETGQIAPRSDTPFNVAEWELEWDVLGADLDGWLPAARLRAFRQRDRQAWERGERVLHVPTYFAWGQV